MLGRVLAAVVLAAVAAGGFAVVRGDDVESVAADRERPPVVMLVFDEFPTDLLLGPDGRIDGGRYPAFAELAREGYWFRNATTTYDSTTKAVPQVLDGRLPRDGVPPTYRGHRWSVYDLFGKRGYEIRRMEAATSVCPPRWCPGARARRPGILDQLKAGRRERLERFAGSIGAEEEPTFWMAHVLLPHGPYLFLPSGRQMRADWQDPIAGMNSTPGFYSDYLALHAQQRLQLQIGFVDRQLGRLIRRMRRERIFDRALIVVTADHGISSESGVRSRRDTSPGNIDELAPVPLLVKAPGQRRGRALRSYARTTDVVPTMADLLGWRMPYRADGRSAFSRAVRRRRTAMVIERDFSRRMTISAAALERRRAALLRTRLRRFGWGTWDRLYTGIGPNRELIGRRAGELPRAPRGSVRASIVGGAAMANVSRRSLVLPTQVAGPIRGARGRETRDLAVAVNGTIEAVGRSFHLRVPARQSARAGESFAVMVPESSMRPGRNAVEVFEVVGGGKLRPLASS
jgi:Sulfatase